MSNWQQIRLGDVCSFQNGLAFKSNEFDTNGDYYVIKIKELKNGYVKLFNESSKVFKNGKNNIYSIKYNDVLIALTGDPVNKPNPCSWVGRVAVNKNKEQLYLNQRVAKFCPNDNFLDLKFIYYYFRVYDNFYDLAQKATGSASQANISTKTIEDTVIFVPSLNKQKQIVKILSSLDDKIELNNRINANLEEQAQALFHHWFVDFEFPNEQGLPYKSNGGTFVDSELGKIPDGWKVGNLFSVATLFDSKRKPLSNIQRASRKGEYPYYGATSVMDYVDDYLFDGTFLLMGEDGSVVNEQGYPFLQYVTGKFWVNNHSHIMQGKNGFSTEMLYCMMKMTNISNLVTGAVQAKLSQTNMNKILFPLATKDILKYFSIMIEPLYALLRKNVYENQTLIQLRDLLLPKLMSGETIWSINY